MRGMAVPGVSQVEFREVAGADLPRSVVRARVQIKTRPNLTAPLTARNLRRYADFRFQNDLMSVNPSNSIPSPDTTPAPRTAIASESHLNQTEEIIIEAESSKVSLGLAELWTYRELLYFLIWRDLKIKYKQTALGTAWAIIQPLFAMLLFTLIFGKLAKMPSDGIPYAAFAYAALLPWTFFANAVTFSGNSLVSSSTLITKIYFPRMLIPMAAVAAGLLDLAIGAILLIPMLIYYDIAIGWSLLLLPLFIILTTLLALAVGMWLSAVNVKYRDVRYALPFLVQLWFFASPVIYPSSIVPDKLKFVFALNPMTGIIDGFRASLFGRAIPWTPVAVSLTLTILLLVCSAFIFRRMEDTFADVI